MISNILEVYPSKRFWTTVLHRFCISKQYCDTWLTSNNLPYMFVFWGMQQMNPFGLVYKKDSAIYRALEKHPHVDFKKMDERGEYFRLDRKHGHWLNLGFRFYQHEQYGETGCDIRENMTFVIDDYDTDTEVFTKNIRFDQQLFSKMRFNASRRKNENLLEIAREKMPDIQPDWKDERLEGEF